LPTSTRNGTPIFEFQSSLSLSAGRVDELSHTTGEPFQSSFLEEGPASGCYRGALHFERAPVLLNVAIEARLAAESIDDESQKQRKRFPSAGTPTEALKH